jgi:hypothetical protein
VKNGNACLVLLSEDADYQRSRIFARLFIAEQSKIYLDKFAVMWLKMPFTSKIAHQQNMGVQGR